MSEPLIDVNVYLSRWPFRRLHDDEPAALAAKLRGQGVTQAWAGSFDAVLHRDCGAVNAKLAEDCRAHGAGLLVPFGAVNPKLPDWEEDLRRCHEVHKMPGIRLHPNYHGYQLDDPLATRLLNLAAERGLVVQIALSMEDERTQHPLVLVPHVDAAPLVEQAKRLPKLRLVIINAFRSLKGQLVDKLAAAGNVTFDIAMLEGVAGVGKLVDQIGAERILFGSYFPFFQFESAALKLCESVLGGVQQRAIRHDNAARLIGDFRPF